MARPRNLLPTYRRHRQSGRGIVTPAGRDHLLLGAFKSAESRRVYERMIGEWIAAGRPEAFRTTAPAAGAGGDVEDEQITIEEPLARFLVHARAYRTPSGKPTSEVNSMKHGIRCNVATNAEHPE
jgi:hypothetical protein